MTETTKNGDNGNTRRGGWVAMLRFAVLPLFSITILSACQFAGLDRDLKELETFASIEGSVSLNSASENPIAVALFSNKLDRDHLINAKLIDTRDFKIGGPPGRYIVFAFEDRSRDFQYQRGEPAGVTTPIVLQAGKNVSGVVIELDKDFLPPEADNAAPDNTQPSNAKTSERATAVRFLPNLWAGRKNIGAITSLGDPKFDEGIAKMGLWEPVKFSLKVGPGIYMLQPYDPAKIPVLFVHGISGSPRNWKLIIDQLDRSRYQPWVMAYASGLPLEVNAKYMYEAITQLWLLYEFDDLFLVAHSMGGLLSRDFVDRYGETDAAYLKVFVTLSTPWGGHDAAQLGIDYAPAVVPAWRDIAPTSAFLNRLREKDLPASVPHHLLFSYRGGGFPSSTANDGTVTVASELEPAAQSKAKRVYGFNARHTEILADEAVIRLLSQILKSAPRADP